MLEQAGFLAAWRRAAAADAVLQRQAAHAAVTLAFESDGVAAEFAFGAGPRVAFTAPAGIWAKALQKLPPRHHHSLFALRMRVPQFSVRGDELAFAQHCHLARRLVEIGRFVAAGGAGPVPETLRPALAEPPPAEIAGRYVGVEPWRIHVEQAGQGPDILCLHTAGADGRQFHRLMADGRITRHWRLTAFDLPWHGKSSTGPEPWFLDTDRYVRIIMGVIAASGLRRPVVLGASMSGEICLELALRHPEAFRGIVACEASAHIEGRKTPWADHPRVNQAIFVPEWIEGLMAPQSPAACAR